MRAIETSRRTLAQARRRALWIIRSAFRMLADLRPTPRRLEIPRVFAGPSDGRTRCALCGKNVPKGAPEYELEWSVTVVIDRACFAMWQTALDRSGHAARPV
jgi:hypothetical protein